MATNGKNMALAANGGTIQSQYSSISTTLYPSANIINGATPDNGTANVSGHYGGFHYVGSTMPAGTDYVVVKTSTVITTSQINWFNDGQWGTSSIKIEVSNDNFVNDIRLVGTFALNMTTNLVRKTQINFAPVKAQYFRFTAMASNNTLDWQIDEIEIIEGKINGRLKDDLQLAGEVSERLPVIRNGLVGHYPFDGTLNGMAPKRNLLDTSQWVLGSNGTQGNFAMNGEAAANKIITFKNPWGVDDTVWASLGNDSANDADGGWNVEYLAIDKTKKYRLTVWIRRENVGSGSGYSYFGCQGNSVCDLGTSTVNVNPYFASGLYTTFPKIVDNWLLFVGYIFPAGYTGTKDLTSGIYSVSEGQIYDASYMTNFQWTSTSTYGGHRTYLYYSTKTDERHYWYRPRMEACDGTEPTIQDLLTGGYDDVRKVGYIPTNIRYIRDWINGSSANTSNHWVEIQAIDKTGTNVALGKTSTVNGHSATSTLTDGDTTSTSYYSDGATTLSNAIVDLGQLYTISQVKIWHYYADGRTYNNTKTEVSQDGQIWYPIFDSAVEGTYVETSAGRTYDLNNLGVTVKQKVTLDEFGDGVSVEDTTTNLQFGQGFGIYNNYSGSGITTTNTQLTNERLYGQPITRVTYQPTTSAALTSVQNEMFSHGVYLGMGTSLTGGGNYCASIYWRSPKSDIIVGGTASNVPGWVDVKTEKLSNGWNRSIARWNDPTTRSDAKYWSFRSPSAQLNEVITIDWACPQLEANRTFATAYYSSNSVSRGYGKLYLKPPAEIQTQGSQFTIHVEARGTRYTQTDYIDIFCDDADRWNGQLRCISGTSYGVGTYGIELLVRATGRGATSNLYAPISNPNDGNWHSYTLVSTGSGAKVYQDGKLVGNFANVYPQYVNNLSVGRNALGDANMFGGWYRNLSIYNRALTDDEVNKLSNKKMGIDDGNIYTTIVEKPQLPSNCIYFPLGASTKDSFKTNGANSEANLVYEKGGVWVGTATTNIPTNQGIDINNLYVYNATVSPTYTKLNDYLNGMKALRVNVGTIASGGVIGFDKTGLTAGSTYSFSVYVRPQTADRNMFLSTDEKSGVTKFCQRGVWTRLTLENFVPASTYRWLTFGGWQNGDIMDVVCPQLENKSFVSPFVNGTLGTSDLEFNLNRDYGLDWSKDWSIVYWKMPVGTHDNTLTGYNIESLGDSPNPTGGGYQWWGKGNATNSIQIASVASITNGNLSNMSNYFGKWHMVSVVRSGSSVTYSWYNIDGIPVRTNTVTLSITAANYFVTPNNYDLKLGGWSNTNVCNTYFRDLIVAKRAFTATELSALANTKMSPKQSLTRVNGSVSEGMVLY
jgi:hypothetical protein